MKISAILRNLGFRRDPTAMMIRAERQGSRPIDALGRAVRRDVSSSN